MASSSDGGGLLAMVGPASGRLGPRPHRHAASDAVQPGPEPARVADRAGTPDQDQERRLEGVLDVVLVAQDATTDAQDERAMEGHQGRESRLVMPRHESLQQLPIIQPRHGPCWKSCWIDLMTAGCRLAMPRSSLFTVAEWKWRIVASVFPPPATRYCHEAGLVFPDFPG